MASQYSLKGHILPELIYLIGLVVLCNVALSMQSNDVNCIVYNEEFMECTWSHSEGKPNYTLHYWYYSEPETECRNYIQQDGYNIGCNFSNNEIKQFRDFNIYRNGFSDSGNESTPTQTFQLQSRVKPNAPGNLKVNATINNGLSLSWEAPMPRRRCLMYRVRYQSNKDKDWQSATVTEQTRFKLASVDSEKLYTFQVQSKINPYCGTTDLWSEWTLPVYWGRNDTQIVNSKEGLHTLISVLSLLGLIVLVVSLMRSERLKVIIIPKIPNPGRSFDPLFDTHNGNFQITNARGHLAHIKDHPAPMLLAKRPRAQAPFLEVLQYQVRAMEVDGSGPPHTSVEVDGSSRNILAQPQLKCVRCLWFLSSPDVKDWLGVPKDTLEGFKSNYHENVCIVSESPPDSLQSSDHGGSYEQLGRTEIPGKASIPGNRGEIQPKNTSPATLFSDIAVFVESSRYAINENIYVRV